MNKVAIIDCGTNTFHLMIATIIDGKFEIIERIKSAVKIGEGGINNGKILPAAQERALSTLKEFRNLIDQQKIHKVLAFGTSAFRNAANGIELRDKIRSEVGIPLEIIDGEMEAELIFKGVNLALNLRNEKTLVMDIGGGSVEFIIRNDTDVLWKKSIEIGGQRLVELFHKNDPITSSEIKELENYLDDRIKELFISLNIFKPTLLAGSSGTFDTLSEIYCREKHIAYNEHYAENPFKPEAFTEIHNKLIRFDRKERMQIPGMIEMRVDMIVVASCLINFILTRYSFKNIRVSTYSLKEGALTEMLN